jgi:hypothetical protein
VKKVYVLNGGCIGDNYVVGVYSSEKRARKEREKIIKTDHYYKVHPDELYIEDFELNVIKDYFKE